MDIYLLANSSQASKNIKNVNLKPEDLIVLFNTGYAVK